MIALSARLKTPLFLFALTALLVASPGLTGRAMSKSTASWCGAGGTGDWLCQQQGGVFVNDVELPAHGSMTVAPETKVSTGPLGIVRLLFPGEARCVAGRAPTELYTRTGGYGALYTQVSGKSACKTNGKRKRIFCGDPREVCPRRMALRGEALTVLTSTTHASASSAEAFTRSGRVEVCEGYAHFQIPNGEGGLEEVEGHVRPGFRWVVEFEEAFSKVEEKVEGQYAAQGSAFSGSIKSAEYRVGYGSCRSEVADF
ncbi:MAG TPA: hypothetical protein VGI73_00240 [Solirubrobacterales bacterium]